MSIQHIISGAFVFLFALTAQSQQEGQFVNFANNPYLLNPAAGGMGDVMQFELTSRAQWLGYNGGPRSFVATGNSLIKVGSRSATLAEYNKKDQSLFASPTRTTGKIKHVVGGRAMFEGIGPFNRTAVYGSYAVHLPFSKSLNIGAGLGVGWSNFSINQNRVILFQEDDAAYSQFLGNTTAQNILDANAGLVFYGEKLFVGISTTQLFKNKAQFAEVLTESNYNRHYFIVAKYAVDAGEKFQIEPTAVAKLAENSPFSGDFGARFIYNKASWFGFQYRTSNSLVFQIGSNLVKNLYLSYGYEQSIGALRTAGNGTHEVQLGIYLGKNRNLDKEIKDGE